jgi:DNA-binding NtrC family response regulator
VAEPGHELAAQGAGARLAIALRDVRMVAEDEIGADVLPLAVKEEAPSSNLGLKVGVSVPEAERRLILATLESFGGDKKRTAEVLKISIKKLYNRLREYGPRA